MSHYVTFTPDPLQDPDDPYSGGELVFECDEPESSDCRWTSDCDCEGWNTQRDERGVFHTPYVYPGEAPPEPQERHDMHLDPEGCIWKPWWDGEAEVSFRDSCGSEWPLRPGRHEVTVTFHVVRHEVKIHHDWLERILEGEKTCEVRRHDRDYQAGDVLDMHCTDCGDLKHGATREITHVLSADQFAEGIRPGYCVLSFGDQ